MLKINKIVSKKGFEKAYKNKYIVEIFIMSTALIMIFVFLPALVNLMIGKIFYGIILTMLTFVAISFLMIVLCLACYKIDIELCKGSKNITDNAFILGFMPPEYFEK